MCVCERLLLHPVRTGPPTRSLSLADIRRMEQSSATTSSSPSSMRRRPTRPPRGAAQRPHRAASPPPATTVTEDSVDRLDAAADDVSDDDLEAGLSTLRALEFPPEPVPPPRAGVPESQWLPLSMTSTRLCVGVLRRAAALAADDPALAGFRGRRQRLERELSVMVKRARDTLGSLKAPPAPHKDRRRSQHENLDIAHQRLERRAKIARAMERHLETREQALQAEAERLRTELDRRRATVPSSPPMPRGVEIVRPGAWVVGADGGDDRVISARTQDVPSTTSRPPVGSNALDALLRCATAASAR